MFLSVLLLNDFDDFLNIFRFIIDFPVYSCKGEFSCITQGLKTSGTDFQNHTDVLIVIPFILSFYSTLRQFYS